MEGGGRQADRQAVRPASPSPERREGPVVRAAPCGGANCEGRLVQGRVDACKIMRARSKVEIYWTRCGYRRCLLGGHRGLSGGSGLVAGLVSRGLSHSCLSAFAFSCCAIFSAAVFLHRPTATDRLLPKLIPRVPIVREGATVVRRTGECEVVVMVMGVVVEW